MSFCRDFTFSFTIFDYFYDLIFDVDVLSNVIDFKFGIFFFTKISYFWLTHTQGCAQRNNNNNIPYFMS